MSEVFLSLGKRSVKAVTGMSSIYFVLMFHSFSDRNAKNAY